LFSHENVSNFINQNFEPAWEMVRPVPIVRIDFGNGDVVTRTLHGNVASYVCTADGQVMDIIPGIYQPAAFTTALGDPRALALQVGRVDAQPRQTRLRQYHQQKAQRIRALQTAVAAPDRPPVRPPNQPPQPAQPVIERDRGKGLIEGRAERQVVNATAIQEAMNRAAAARRPRTATELANWLPLAEDTRLNEMERRLMIHDRFSNWEAIQPNEVKGWLYRDVLHADLADPHMGLGDEFFAEFER
jgi:hypothetical protein